MEGVAFFVSGAAVLITSMICVTILMLNGYEFRDRDKDDE